MGYSILDRFVLLVGIMLLASASPCQQFHSWHHGVLKNMRLPGTDTLRIEVPNILEGKRPFVSCAIGVERDRLFDIAALELVYDGQHIVLSYDPHYAEDEIVRYTPLYFLPADVDTIWIVNTAEEDVSVVLYMYFPYPSRDEKSWRAESRGGDRRCDSLPPYKRRSQWCPGGCPPNPNPIPTEPTHMIVHHSAGTNTASDWDAVVRNIWHFHVVTRGWADIGYNWLIAPTGQLYEGRGDGIKGAHFCGTNSNTVGICMMGNYMTIGPSGYAVHTLEQLLTWTAHKWRIKPEEKRYHRVSGLNLFGLSGHRDGCSTLCPGDSLYARLPAIRKTLSQRLQACAGDTMGTFVKTQWTNTSLKYYFMPEQTMVIHMERTPQKTLYWRIVHSSGKVVQRGLWYRGQRSLKLSFGNLAPAVYYFQLDGEEEAVEMPTIPIMVWRH